MQRRTFLSLTFTGVSGLIVDPLPGGAMPLGTEPLGQLGLALARLRQLDGRDGSASIMVAAHFLAARLIRALNTPPPHQLHHPLAELAADAAQLAGWVSYETGDYPEALHWYDRAIRAAQEAHDPDLAAFAGEARACVYWLGIGDTKTALGQLDNIQLDGVSNQIRAQVHEGRARALALDGKEKQSLVALDQAKEAAANDGPSWAGGWFGSPLHVQGGHGLTLVDLGGGYGEKAYKLLTGTLRRLPPRLHRVAGTQHRGLAKAALLMGEPVQAAAHVVQAHEIHTATKSRQLAELRVVVVDLRARYGDVKAVRDLRDQLRAKPDGDAGWRYEISGSRRGGKGLHLSTCPQLKRRKPGKERHPWYAGAGRDPADVAHDPAVRARFAVCKSCLPG